MAFGAVLTGLGAVLSAVMTGYGISQQREETERVRGMQLGMFDKEFGLSQEQLDLQKRQQRVAEREKRKEWKWVEEKENYDRSQKFISDFRNLMDQSTMFRQNMINIWRQK